MSLNQLLNQNKLKSHRTSKEEIQNLIELIKRDIKDAKVTHLSSDRRFAIAYNAVLQSATILLYCKGYKPKGLGHHFTVFQAMKGILEDEYNDLADYFDSCRSKRNITDYSNAGEIAQSEAEELIEEAEEFLTLIQKWIRKNYPDLI
jgi:uncharacterized protein (UPF0332 family)